MVVFVVAGHINYQACRHRCGQLSESLARVRLYSVPFMIAGFQTQPRGSLLREWGVWAGRGLSSALLLPEFCCLG